MKMLLMTPKETIRHPPTARIAATGRDLVIATAGARTATKAATARTKTKTVSAPTLIAAIAAIATTDDRGPRVAANPAANTLATAHAMIGNAAAGTTDAAVSNGTIARRTCATARVAAATSSRPNQPACSDASSPFSPAVRTAQHRRKKSSTDRRSSLPKKVDRHGTGDDDVAVAAAANGKAPQQRAVRRRVQNGTPGNNDDDPVIVKVIALHVTPKSPKYRRSSRSVRKSSFRSPKA